MSTTEVGICSDDPFVRYVVALAADFSGLPLVAGRRSSIKYGETETGVLSIPRCQSYSLETIPPIPDAALCRALKVPGAHFPFDLFSAIRFWICDEAHQDAKSADFDTHDRLKYRASAQHRMGLGTVPIVNAYLKLFESWLEAQTGLNANPRAARIILSHDVDEPVAPGDLGHNVWLLGSTAMAAKPRATLGHLRALPKQLMYKLRHGDHTHWNFEAIVRLEKDHGFASAFYFASTPWWMPDASPYDVTYDVRSPGFRSLFKSLRAQGAEVGLHISYNARDNIDLMRREFTRLEKVSNGLILGARHHYWHMKEPFWDTLEAHGQVGLQYDSSVAFNDAPGYRLGIAHPFYPWNPNSDGPVHALQIPSALMDGALLYDEKNSAESALETIDHFLDDLALYRGTAAVDWHVRTSYPGRPQFERWARVYGGLLDRLSRRPDIEVVTPGQILDSCTLASNFRSP